MTGTYERGTLRDVPIRDSGPYEAMVVSHHDMFYQGTLLVELLRHQGSSTTPRRTGQLVSVRYLSPFYGVTPYDGLKPEEGFQNTQKSYGFWMVPPDFGTTVLVVFAEGNSAYGYWIGCVQDTTMNFMVPGGTSSTQVHTEGTPNNLEGKKLPVGEYNKLRETGERVDPTQFEKPYNKDFTEVLEVQGLLEDEARGTTTSSARRETPSMVFGISTPGPYDKRAGAPTARYGADEEEALIPFNRLGGSSIVMDDGDDKFLRATHAEDGPPIYINKELGEEGGDETIPQNELLRFRTRTGHQILMHNSEDFIYIANSRGTAWIELTSDGKIDIHAQDSISIMTDNDFNITAERDINIEAGRNINMKASARWSDFRQVEQGKESGRVHIESAFMTNIHSGRHWRLSAENNFEITAQNDILFTAQKNFHIRAENHLYQQAGGNIHERAGHSIYRTSESNINDRATGIIMQTAEGSVYRKSISAGIFDQAALDIHQKAGQNFLETAGLNHEVKAGNSSLTTAAENIEEKAGSLIVEQASGIHQHAAGGGGMYSYTDGDSYHKVDGEKILKVTGNLYIGSDADFVRSASGQIKDTSATHIIGNGLKVNSFIHASGNIETQSTMKSARSESNHVSGGPGQGGLPGAIVPDAPASDTASSAREASDALAARRASDANAALGNLAAGSHGDGSGSGSGSSPLTTFTLPYVIPGVAEPIPYQTIVPRAPQHEPWPHHENLNPLAFKKHETDREHIGTLTTADRVLTPDTFANGRAGVSSSIRVAGSGGNIYTGTEGSSGNDGDVNANSGAGAVGGSTVVAGEVPAGVSNIPAPPAGTNDRIANVPGVLRPNVTSLDRNLPRQNIIDSLSVAASVVIPNGIVQITPGGGASGRDEGTTNHPYGHAADFQFVINGQLVRLNDNPGLYQRMAEELIANANARGVMPGLGGYNTFLHYDESPRRQSSAITQQTRAHLWGNTVGQAHANVVNNRRIQLDANTIALAGTSSSSLPAAGTHSGNARNTASPGTPGTAAPTGATEIPPTQNSGASPNGARRPEYPPDLTQAEMEAWIREEAPLRNLDPDVAVRIFRAEGAGAYQSTVERQGTGSYLGREASWGPYQLYTGNGLGGQYEQETGRNLLTDNTREGIRNQIRWALDHAATTRGAQGGWQPWHGRIPAGVGQYDGNAGNGVAVNNWD